MTDQLRIGIIGVNGIGQWHLWALRAVRTVQCGRRLRHRRRRVPRRLRPSTSVPAFTDTAAALRERGVDAVVVGDAGRDTRTDRP